MLGVPLGAKDQGGAVMPDDVTPNGMDRRRMLKQVGLGAAIVWTAPVISSIESRAAAASAPGGGTCKRVSCCDGTNNPVGCAGTPADICAGPTLGQCFCGQATEGQCVCLLDTSDFSSCTSSADCGPGRACVDTCLGTVCLPFCPAGAPAGIRFSQVAGGRSAVRP